MAFQPGHEPSPRGRDLQLPKLPVASTILTPAMTALRDPAGPGASPSKQRTAPPSHKERNHSSLNMNFLQLDGGGGEDGAGLPQEILYFPRALF